MANDEEALTGEVANAIALLCDRTDSKYVNVFNKSTLQDLARPAGRERYIVATGPYAFHEWRPGDDVVLVILSRTSRSVLWQLLEEELFLPSKPLANKSELEISAHNLSMTTTWGPSILAKFEALSRMNKGCCKFYLRYCQLPKGFDPSIDLLFTPYDFNQKRNIPPSSTSDWNLSFIRDMQFIAGAVQCGGPPVDLTQPTLFRAMFKRLRQWTQNCGVYGVRFGFLNSECITWVVYHALWADGAFGEGRKIDQVDDDSQFRAVLEFFQSLMDDIDSKGERRNEVQIITPQERIISRYLTPDKLNAVRSALKTSISTDLDLNYEDQLHEFLCSSEYYLKVDFTSWETSPVLLAELEDNFIPETIREVMSYLRHENSNKHIDAGLHIRLWPKPLVENEQEHQSTYAVGLTCPSTGQPFRTEPMDRYIGRLVAELSDIVSAMPTSSTTLTVVSATTGEELLSILQAAKSDDAARPCTGQSRSAQSGGESTTTTGRFRTAAEAISRLRHDPAHAAVEYDLGYEDRFDGLVWMGLENWGSWATEDETFVAEHRVRVLKRRADGVVVWDRENRIDRTGL